MAANPKIADKKEYDRVDSLVGDHKYKVFYELADAPCGLASGIEDKFIHNKKAPLNIPTLPCGAEIPEWLLDDNNCCSSAYTIDLISTNDKKHDITEKQRERKVSKIFKKHGVKVVFE